MKTMTIAALVVGVTLAAGVRDAAAREWELEGGAAMHWLSSSGVDAAASADLLTLGELGAAVEVLRGLPVVDRLFAELRWQSGSTSATDFGAFDARLDLASVELGVRAVHQLWPRVRVYVHADLGRTRGELAITGSGSSRLGSVDWTTSASAGAGAELTVFQQAASDPHPDFALGVRLELGYAATGQMAFSARPSSTSDVPLAARAAPLGDLDADGVVLRFGVFGRF